MIQRFRAAYALVLKRYYKSIGYLYPFESVAGVELFWFFGNKWHATDPAKLQNLKARDIWVGYENGGWADPDIYKWHSKMYDAKERIVRTIEVWVFYSALKDDYQVFVHDNLVPDENGGIHPCGWGQVVKTDLDYAVI